MLSIYEHFLRNIFQKLNVHAGIKRKNVMILCISEFRRMFMMCMMKVFPVLALSVTVPTDFIGSVL